MRDAPRPPEQSILPRALLTWLVFAGLTMAAITLGVIWWATPVFGDAVARTMGLTAFSISNIWFALETSDERASLFSATTLENPTLLKAAGIAFAFIVVGSELRIFNRILDTVNLTTDQWILCVVLSLAVLVVAEIRKLVAGRGAAAAEVGQAAEASAAA